MGFLVFKGREDSEYDRIDGGPHDPPEDEPTSEHLQEITAIIVRRMSQFRRDGTLAAVLARAFAQREVILLLAIQKLQETIAKGTK
jgi:hypothetical protein